MEIINFENLKYELRDFAKLRDWQKFHNPKSLAMALSVEVGELVEIFQWLSDKESVSFCKDVEKKEQVSHELADILLYLTLIADKFDINLNQAVREKILLNSKKYPAIEKIVVEETKPTRTDDLSKVFLKNF